MTKERKTYNRQIGNYVIGSLDSDGTLVIDGTGKMADYATLVEKPWDENRLSITKIIVNDGVTHIGKNAFYGCTNVTSVELPDSVTSIGDMAFGECSSLEGITLPCNVTRIGVSAFQDSGLTRIMIPAGVTNIGHGAFNMAFSGYSKLKAVVFEGKVTVMGTFCFYNHGAELITVTVPSADLSYYAGHEALSKFNGRLLCLDH